MHGANSLFHIIRDRTRGRRTRKPPGADLHRDFQRLKADLPGLIHEAIQDAVQTVGESAPGPSLLTIDDVARLLNVSRRTVENLVADGELVPLRIRGARRFTPEMVDVFLRTTAGKKVRRRRK